MKETHTHTHMLASAGARVCQLLVCRAFPCLRTHVASRRLTAMHITQPLGVARGWHVVAFWGHQPTHGSQFRVWNSFICVKTLHAHDDSHTTESVDDEDNHAATWARMREILVFATVQRWNANIGERLPRWRMLTGLFGTLPDYSGPGSCGTQHKPFVRAGTREVIKFWACVCCYGAILSNFVELWSRRWYLELSCRSFRREKISFVCHGAECFSLQLIGFKFFGVTCIQRLQHIIKQFSSIRVYLYTPGRFTSQYFLAPQPARVAWFTPFVYRSA